MPLSSRQRGWLAAVVTIAIWSSFIVVARASAQHTLSSLDIAFMRLVGASLVLWPWGAWIVWRGRQQARLQGSALPPSSCFGLSPLPWRITWRTGLLGGLLYAMLAYSGFFLAPAAHASVLMPGSLPLWTTLLSVWLLGLSMTRGRALSLALILGGDLLVGGSSLLQAFQGGDVWRGDLLFMSASFCWASYSVLARRHALDPVHATVAITVFAGLLYLPVYGGLAWSGWVPSQLLAAPWQELVFQALMQGVGSVVISGITFNIMLQHYGPVRSTMLTATVPGLSALGAVLWLGEPLYWNLLAGLGLVTLGIVLGVRAGQSVSSPTPAKSATS